MTAEYPSPCAFRKHHHRLYLSSRLSSEVQPSHGFIFSHDEQLLAPTSRYLGRSSWTRVPLKRMIETMGNAPLDDRSPRIMLSKGSGYPDAKPQFLRQALRIPPRKTKWPVPLSQRHQHWWNVPIKSSSCLLRRVTLGTPSTGLLSVILFSWQCQQI